jgi:mannan endo-1,4-beta-mannosidase
LADSQRLGRHRQIPPERFCSPIRRRASLAAAALVCVVLILVMLAVYGAWPQPRAERSSSQNRRDALPTSPSSYVGVYARGVPDSYTGVKAFTTAIGIKPSVLVYYSGWFEPFNASFATTAANEGAVPLVQINPTAISLAAIAGGHYDGYLSAYAKAVRAYHRPVILSFGHEMNGHWFSWCYQHTSPTLFVAAWRHIVTTFRKLGVRNVTWLWTVNIIQKQYGVPSPGPWWPGATYVNWVGIDGYYATPSSEFATLFGPTIVYIRSLTHDPILIAETSATPVSSQPTKIANLFAGIHLYGLLGFVWFDAIAKVDWRLSSPAAIAAFRESAERYYRPKS